MEKQKITGSEALLKALISTPSATTVPPAPQTGQTGTSLPEI